MSMRVLTATERQDCVSVCSIKTNCSPQMKSSVTNHHVHELYRLCVLWRPGLTVLWQSALISCSSWLSNFSRDGWREMVSLLRVKGSILSSWGLSRASPGDSANTASDYQHAVAFTQLYNDNNNGKTPSGSKMGFHSLWFSNFVYSSVKACGVGVAVEEKQQKNTINMWNKCGDIYVCVFLCVTHL